MTATAAQATIARLYSALSRLDGDTMQACCAADARFDDEAFALKGADPIGGMWRMPCSTPQAKGRDVWRPEFADVTDPGAHWEAHCRFSATGRIAHNLIEADIPCGPDGLIQRQRDSFDLWRWARQSLGAPGLLRGWTPFLRRKVRAQAAANLAGFMASSLR